MTENLKEKSLQKHQGLFEEDESISSSQRFISYFSLYSLLLAIGTTPPTIQKFLVHSLQPIGVAGIAFTFSVIVNRPWLSFIPIVGILFIFGRNISLHRRRYLAKKSSAFRTHPYLGNVNYRKSQLAGMSLELAGEETPIDPVELSLTSLDATPADTVNNAAKKTPLEEIFCELSGLDMEVEGNEILGSESPVRSKTRPVYRGMYSLPTDDGNDNKSPKKSSRKIIRKSSSSLSQLRSLSHRTLSRVLRMISMNEAESDSSDNDSFGDSFSSESRFGFDSDSEVSESDFPM